MSRKTVSISLPAAPAQKPAAEAPGSEIRADAWVARNDGPSPGASPSGPAADAILLLDLSAERTLSEVMMLSLLVPFALGWLWFVQGMAAGRFRL